ncbi:alpha-acetolactate decarboxylase [Flavobacterium salilacus subsp. salilacus]|uniref:acetolactate decarboxylase n=1 Tax=Flavobacterium TaxID=237 RepID=UPI001074DDE5|nr:MULTISPECIES: acetolactate decarboxylase [Flavobacterium]KAF2518659.1 alpha-acetolactate decarboxylase [Flavobacterium salilacus subsp. salilacus]MBE1613621.1 acetolactate decarboxylase [Flavobacterium sp. SaA2.13]
MSANFKTLFVLLTIALLIACTNKIKKSTNEVIIVGAMKNVMQKGELQGTINLDTIANKKHLYGLGPVEYLKGEIMIFDGTCYKSTVTSPTAMIVEETFEVKAPFFGYTTITDWTEQQLPENIGTLKELENYLAAIAQEANRPFMFKLNGTVENVKIHVVNLPEGTKVSSPKEAHKGLTHYKIKNQKVDILGFFSTEHKAVLTHHDTYIHLHLLTADRKQMGHLDDVTFKKGAVTLYLPKEK